ncbi:Gfo/Idh/MocA family protein [Roseobacter sinensis]|uniref:Gfo/Idh/MocA family oxidoreductase n=1 Tax=Roseobacter sinensis TaxID=2931391 RepID=A0ABT3BJY7_9RHOB|nr:Gfo/Idh/MocA family oxidoreductase [Roseobacter sp. WL0113]MCV3273860.1 Gfo/Idh/MocA family oxidoreductase [Roseobacter sp. WL0113]
MTLRIGLVGCGRVAGFHHGPILSRISGARVTALIDPDPDARKAMARLHPGAVSYMSVDRAITLGEVDALVICTPPAHHADAAIAGLEAGLHVYVEKPIALSLEDADRMIAAAQGTDKVAMVGHNFRLHPKYRAARKALAEGTLGGLVAVRTLFTSEKRVLPGWKSAAGAGGDAITDLAIHHFDIVRYLAGADFAPASVRAQITQQDEGSLATVSAQLESGQPVTITVGQLTGQNTHKVELLCDAGHLEIDLYSNGAPLLSRPAHALSLGDRLSQRLQMLRDAADIRYKPDPSFEAALRSFVRAARSADGPAQNEVPLEVGRRALALALSAAHATSQPAI